MHNNKPLTSQLHTSAQTTALTDFLTDYAHDIYQPLRTVAGCITIIQEDYGALLPSQADTYFKSITQTLHHLNNFVKDRMLLHVHNQENTTILSIESLMEDVKLMLMIPLQEKQATMLHRCKFPVIKGNRQSVQRLFLNLINNALQSAPEGHHPVIDISVNAPLHETKATFFIKDNNPSVTTNHKQKTNDTSQTRVHLGLLISQTLLGELGHTLALTPNEGENGYTVSFMLEKVIDSVAHHPHE